MDRWSSIEDWADAYIRVYDQDASLDESHPDYLAAYEFMVELVGSVAEECWKGILAVVERQPSEKVLGMLSAGLMEDLIHYSGDEFIERIEECARRNPIFRQMLHDVWESGSPETWARVEAARSVNANAT